MILTDSLLDLLVQSIAAAVWNRPELTRFREPIEVTLKGDPFKALTEKAFRDFSKNTGNDLPDFFDEGFVTMPAVQRHLAVVGISQKRTLSIT